MNKILVNIAVLSVFLLFSACAKKEGIAPPSEINEPRTENIFTVAGSHDLPFRIFNGEEVCGIYFDIIKEIGQRCGIKFKFVNCTFERALELMRTGGADIMIGAVVKENRKDYMVYLEPYFRAEAKNFYGKKETVEKIRSYDDLKGFTISVHIGKTYFEPFDSDQGLKKDPVSSYEIAVDKVLAGRSDLVIMPECEGRTLLTRMGVYLDTAPFMIKGTPCHVTLSKRSVLNARSGEIEKTLRELMTEGVIDRLFKQYGCNDE